MKTTKTLARNLTIRYALVQGFFWISFLSILGFAAIYLKWKHYNTGQIGIILSLSSLVAVMLQPMIAAFADKTTKISIKNITSLTMLFTFFMGILLLVLPNSLVITGMLYVIIASILFSLPPLLNSMALEYINCGIPINYGLARGIGSVSFAIMSYFLGFMIHSLGAVILLPLFLFTFAILILLTYTFRVSETTLKELLGLNSISNNKNAVKTESELNILSFLLHYKLFTIQLLGIIFLFTSHSMLNTYLIKILEHVGGNSTHTGISLAIAAALELPTMAVFVLLVKKIKCSVLLKISAFFFIIKAGILIFATNIALVYLSQAFQLVSYALFIPASVDYVNKIMPEQDKVKGQAFVGVATMGAGGILGNLIAGQILNTSGVPFMVLASTLLCVLGCIIIFFSTEDIA